MQAMEVRDREIEFRLEAYARARLSPDPRAVARSRARIMRESRLLFEAAPVASIPGPVVALSRHRSIARRLAVPILAASVWIVIAVGSIFAAQPGGPLFATRMWVENATLPSAGPQRASTEIGRLDARLAEASAAATRGDSGAVQAALDAYRQIADDTLAATAGDPTLEALVAAALDKDRVVLGAVAASLADKGNDAAAAAVEASIERAIAHNQAVIDRIDARGVGGPSNGATGGPGSNTGNGTGAGTGAGAGSGGATGSGTGTGGDAKPAKTPKPAPNPTPSPSHGQPDHSSRGQND